MCPRHARGARRAAGAVRRARPVLGALAALALLAGCGGGEAGGEADQSPRPSGSSSDPAPSSPGASAAPAEGSAEVIATVARGLDSPWGIARLPGGDLLICSRDEGTLSRIAAGSGEVTEVGRVPGVTPGGEGGLLGLALDPGFASTGRLFVYYTTRGDNRVTSFRYDATAPAGERLTRPTDVLTGIPRGEVVHNGGRLAFGPDGMLYVSTGDTDNSGTLSQDPDSPAGKILRIDPATGRPPADNPDPDSPVYSLGHRNVQGLAWDAEGRLWATEFGDHSFDELNLIRPGGNYGWPRQEGRGGEEEGFVDPVEQWPPEAASPSGLAYQRGSLWLTALRGERLWRVPLDGAEPAGEPQSFLEGEYGRLRSVLALGEDRLLVVTNETDSRGSPAAGDDRVLLVRVR
ncbi:PQQ-dependent sugar dehydrogenase [Streptomyces hoynatensis]|uniref:PQQ-dependent sugar dehydrogenase n=1 Tax=Streptomyces hoynatensis TaxID=1141874 RepID=A0A3A9YY91_9ACTN|nr:PQQ-dependent sugar dehydrogenase [Streptomyces hoynatensis]RKN40739.1 PQQ-dependent sugar dehydrogenase [Streptomyces hoynatensis]